MLHFVSVPIGLFLILAGYYNPVNNFFLSDIPFLARYGQLASDVLFNGLIIGYNVATVGKYYQFRKNSKVGEHLKNSVHPVWMNISIWGFIVSCSFVQLGNYLNKIMPNDTVDWTIIGLIAFLIYFCVLFYVAVSSRVLLERSENPVKYKNTALAEEEELQLLKALDECMESKRLFTNQELKIKELAEILNTSERNLSQVINKCKNQNFPDYINTYRIAYAMKLLSDPSLSDKTILWILFEAGFNSKATFNTLFKKVVGSTPAEYRKANSK